MEKVFSNLMEAIILAGGFGTRLQSVIHDVPKPMAPINGKPFLEYLLKYLQKNGISRVILSVGYMWEKIEAYFGDRYENLHLIYSIEDKPLGTGGAIKKALETVKSEQVFVLNGDTFFNIDLSKLRLRAPSVLQLSLKEMYDFDRYGNVKIDKDGYVKSFQEKRHCKKGLINGGVYLIKSNLFRTYQLPDHFSFEDFMEQYLKELCIAAEVFQDYFIDIGIPEDYLRAQNEIMEYM